MKNQNGQFRFTYFTDMYEETLRFYADKLGFILEHSWDRNAHDKGALFKTGTGLIEVLYLSPEEERNAGLDYRSPQGAFMGIQFWDIDELFDKYKSLGVSFKQEVTD
ncbi:MAG: VOC family protein [Bacteroidota bacterium]